MSTYTYVIIILIALVCVAAAVVMARRGRGARTAPAAQMSADEAAAKAAGLLAAVGGKENVASLEYCATRLRFEVKSYAQVNEAAAKAAGAAGVIRPGKNSCQIAVGTAAPQLYAELKKLM